MFNTTQEEERKEVERAFGVLQRKFRFLSTANSVELWDKERIRKILTASAILHNMAIEDIWAERQDGELYVRATAGAYDGILVGAENGAQFEWERAVAGAEGQAPRPGSFPGMCLVEK
jgi:Plant transposon protein